MYAKIILAAAALAIATPVLAKTAPAADLPTGPVAYADLAAVDAKLNPPAAPVKAKHKHKAKAAAAAPAAAPAKP